MACHARREHFVPKLQHSLSFKYISSTTQAKPIINLLLLNHFYPSDVTPTSSIRKRQIVQGLVARYGLQSVASASG